MINAFACEGVRKLSPLPRRLPRLRRALQHPPRCRAELVAGVFEHVGEHRAQLLRALAEDQAELKAALQKLLQLVIENISELVEDDKWVQGQIGMVLDLAAVTPGASRERYARLSQWAVTGEQAEAMGIVGGLRRNVFELSGISPDAPIIHDGRCHDFDWKV